MERQGKIFTLIGQKKYDEAFRIYEETPIFQLKTEKPLLLYKYFEFSKVHNKNPVFLRVLLNYISLINILFDYLEDEPFNFHNALFKFCAKFCFETKDNFTQFVLMVKSNISVYNNIFEKNQNTFKNTGYELGTIDYDFKKNGTDIAGIGYSFQELGKTFIKDEILGDEVGVELPNLIFYLESNQQVESLIGKIFFLPANCKMNFEERRINFGYNEVDQVILINKDFTITKDELYFQNIEIGENDKLKVADFKFTKDCVYFLEYKSNGALIKIEESEKINNLYITLFNNNVINNLKTPNLQSKFSLHVYDHDENSGHRIIKKNNGENNNSNIKFIYLNPSCQMKPLMNLKTQVYVIKEELSEYKILTNKKFEEYDKKFNEINQKSSTSINNIKETNIIPAQQNKFNEINGVSLVTNSQTHFFDGFIYYPMNPELKNNIENSFKEIASEVNNIKDLNKFEKLFEDNEQGIEEFLQIIEDIHLSCNTNINEDIKNLKDGDYSLCYNLLASYIGKNKLYPKNFNVIKKFFFNKIKKNDEMKFIYKAIYLCLFGTRTEDNSIIEKFYPSAKTQFVESLNNIIKYTFCLDLKRKGKEYYMLLLFKELLKCGYSPILETIITFKDKSFFWMIFIVIILINSENQYFYNFFNDFKKKNNL